MTPRKCERALRHKLAAQGAELVDAKTTEISFFFIISEKKQGFTVPRPPEPFGWTAQQQDHIASTLEYFELEFWPLDYNT